MKLKNVVYGKFFINVLLIIVSIVLLFNVFYFLNGSFEKLPTQEENKRVQTAILLIITTLLIIEAVLIFLRIRIGKVIKEFKKYKGDNINE